MAVPIFSKNELVALPTVSLVSILEFLSTRQEEVTNALASAQSKLDNLQGTAILDSGNSGGLVPTRLPTQAQNALTTSKNSAGKLIAVSTVIDSSLEQNANPIKNPSKIGLESGSNLALVLSSVSSKLGDISTPVLNDILVREEALKAQRARILSTISMLEDEIVQLTSLISRIENIIDSRISGEIEEPRYEVSGVSSDISDFLKLQIQAVASVAQAEIISDPLFDLEFGPPISKSGQFVLSRDGLYYDSRGGGLPEVIGIIEMASKWKLDYAPNLGGKGKKFTEKDLLSITDTVFDIDEINDSVQMREIYDHDLVLQNIERDKAKVVYDLSGQVAKALADGESADGAIVTNLRQSMLAIVDSINQKIRKRKKQVEIAIFFGGYGYKDQRFYNNANQEEVKYIPVNDFSYLRGLANSPGLEKQKKLLLNAGDVKDVILPIQPKFLTTPTNAIFSVDELKTSFGAIQDFIHIEGFDIEDVKPFIKSISEGLASDLLVGFNFITPKIEDPSSIFYYQDNFAAGHKKLDCKIIADSITTVFKNGLGIPYFYGVTGNSPVDIYGNSNRYSYAVLDNTRSSEVQDIFYKANGVTFDFWAHAPLLSNPGAVAPEYQPMFTSGHLYRLFFGNENSGDALQTAYNPNVKSQYNENKVMGMICGLRNATMLTGTPTNLTNYSEMEFIFAPTVGTNNSGLDSNPQWGDSIMILNRGTSASTGLTDNYEFKVSSTSINKIRDEFIHLALRINFLEGSVDLFADGAKLATSAIENVFGVTKPKLPTFFTPSSNTMSSLHYAASSQGPPLAGQLFTPLVIGGGYSDLALTGFLGANLDTYTYEGGPTKQHPIWSNSGFIQRSGLNGFIGSFKIYSRALTDKEIEGNYKVQKQFFKTIDLPFNPHP